MVGVNTSTKVYHKDGEFYGTAKRGEFMTEDDAVKAGYRAAKAPASKKKAAGTAARRKCWFRDNAGEPFSKSRGDHTEVCVRSFNIRKRRFR